MSTRKCGCGNKKRSNLRHKSNVRPIGNRSAGNQQPETLPATDNKSMGAGTGMQCDRSLGNRWLGNRSMANRSALFRNTLLQPIGVNPNCSCGNRSIGRVIDNRSIGNRPIGNRSIGNRSRGKDGVEE